MLPGFTASDVSTAPLRRLLERRGYEVFGWGLGRNLGFNLQLEILMHRRLQSVYYRSGRRVSLVGWSLGGVFARELAKERPEMVRQVVTLGSPFAQSARATSIWRLYERITGETIEELEQLEMVQNMRHPPSVPSTAVYSKTDGVAHWRACREPEAPSTDNIEIPGSHCGLGHNPLAAYAVLDRLALPEDGWEPFAPKGWIRNLYPLSREWAIGARARAARS